MPRPHIHRSTFVVFILVLGWVLYLNLGGFCEVEPCYQGGFFSFQQFGWPVALAERAAWYHSYFSVVPYYAAPLHWDFGTSRIVVNILYAILLPMGVAVQAEWIARARAAPPQPPRFHKDTWVFVFIVAFCFMIANLAVNGFPFSRLNSRYQWVENQPMNHLLLAGNILIATEAVILAGFIGQRINAKEKFPPLQIHLSTAVILMHVAGMLIWANCPRSVSDYHPNMTELGWPCSFYSAYYAYLGWLQESYDWPALAGDVVLALAILFLVAFALEWRIRRRAKLTSGPAPNLTDRKGPEGTGRD